MKKKSSTSTENLLPVGGLTKSQKYLRKVKKYGPFYIMFLPVLIFLICFNYLPMLGIRIAFYDWGIMGPVEFLGFGNFQTLLKSSVFQRAFRNTLQLSLLNLILGMFFSVFFALLLNEVNNLGFKKLSQTILYLPHFLSWVVVASIFTMILSPDGGMINNIRETVFKKESIYFLTEGKMWRPIYLFINRWKETGWGTIIYLAALTGIDQELYEAASIDGAGKIKQTWYITLPSIMNTILVVFIMNLAKVLNVFESVFVLQNALVMDTSDVIGTYTYRLGLLSSDYGMSTAIGLFKSTVSLVLVTIANFLSKKIKGKGIL